MKYRIKRQTGYKVTPIWAWAPEFLMRENEVNIMTKDQFDCWCRFPWKGKGVPNFGLDMEEGPI